MQQIVSFRPRTTKALKLTGFRGAPHQVFFTDASGLIHELALGAANTVLTSTGPTTPPSFVPTGVAGTLTSTESTGIGASVAGNIVAGVAQFRTLAAASGISITDDSETLTFALVPSLIPAFTGATIASNGNAGGVPAPAIAERARFLRGDGTWADVPAVVVTAVGAGASPIYSTNAAALQLRTITAASSRVAVVQGPQEITIDVNVANLNTMTGATSTVAGARGVVPAPSAGDQSKFLRGDGTWQAPAVVSIANVGSGAGVYKNYTTQQNLRSLRSMNANLTIVQTTDEITLDLSSAVVAAPMTGATVSTDGEAGLVPKPYVIDRLLFLRGDGTWAAPTVESNAENIGAGVDVYNGVSALNALQFRRVRSLSAAIGVTLGNDSVTLNFDAAQIAAMTGATDTTNGARGMVPAPILGDNTRFLRGDGTWAEIVATVGSGTGAVGDVPVYIGTTAGVSKIALLRGVAPVEVSAVTTDVIAIGVTQFIGATAGADGAVGAVPAPLAGGADRFLSANGSWSTIAAMVGATGVAAGTAGLVPAPGIGADNRFLRGDGAWVDISGVGEINTASNAGSGYGLFRSKIGFDLSFKSLVAGTAIAITSQADTLTVSVVPTGLPVMTGATAIMAGERGVVPPPAAGDNSKVLYGDGVWRVPPGASGGESNSAVNMGVGVPLFIQKTGIDLEFRSLRSSHAAILVTGDPDEIFVGLNPANIPAFTGATAGTPGTGGGIPAPATGDQAKFLRADGTWQTVVLDNPVMTGATPGSPGVQGLVPQPLAADTFKFLRGDGTWATAAPLMTGASPTVNGTSGAVPGPAAGDDAKFLRGDGTWQEVLLTNPDMVGATAVVAGEAGRVPAPAAGNHGKFLRGDGTWADPVGATPTWGGIVGVLGNQSDLLTALNAKSNITHSHAAFTGATSSTNGVLGSVPAPAMGDEGRFLRGDGLWTTIASALTPFTGATAGTDGAVGAVPAPLAGEEDAVLHGDGTWRTASGGGGGSSTIISGLTGLVAGSAYRFNGTAWVLGSGANPTDAAITAVAISATELVTGGVAPITGLTPGGDYWLSPNPLNYGALVTPEPTWVYGDTRVYVGMAISASELLVEIDIGDVILNVFETTSQRATARASKSTIQYYPGASTYAVVNFDLIVSDSATAITTGVGWQYVVPRAGSYLITAAAGLAVPTTTEVWIAIFVNGSVYSEIAESGNSAGNQGAAQIMDVVTVGLNDTISVRIKSALTGNIWSAISRITITEM